VELLTYTEVKNVSWFERIKQALVGVIIGVLLFIAAFPLLFWNEGRAVRTEKSLKEGAKSVVSIPSDVVNSENEGKLVHLSGMTATEDILTDPTFGISQNAVKLKRKVEMYQWEEESKTETHTKVGGGEEHVTTYEYRKVWSERHINSSKFKETGHKNPSSMPYESAVYTAGNVTLGAFRLNSSLTAKIGNFSQLPVTEEDIPSQLQKQFNLHNNTFYAGTDPANPEVGDLKVSFYISPVSDVSVLAMQHKETFTPYQTKAGDQLERLDMGLLTAAQMFERAHSENRILTWILRVVGFLMLFIGLALLGNPLKIVADFIPFVGRIVGVGVGLFAGILSFSFWVLTVGAAWIFYRPLLGIPLVLMSAAGITSLVTMAKNRKPVPALSPESSTKSPGISESSESLEMEQIVKMPD
jgi:hypothetical protein